MRSTTLKYFVALGAAALLAACGGKDKKDSTGPGDGTGGLGSFSGGTTGSLTITLAGSAIFGTENDGLAAVGLELGLGAFGPSGGTDSRGSVVFWRENQALPTVGDHDIANLYGDAPVGADQFLARLHLKSEGGEWYYCDVTGGILHVGTATASKVSGSFTLTAVCARPTVDESLDVTANGEFAADKGIQTISTGQ